MGSKINSNISTNSFAGSSRARVWFYVMAAVLAAILAFPAMSPAIEIDDEPIESRPQPGAPMVMFVLDDSGSMDWEFMTTENQGTFDGEYYLFPAASYSTETDHQYSDYNILSSGDRNQWKSQWFGYNKVYYHPYSNYLPWISTSTYTFADQDLDHPRSNPINASPTIDMADTFYSVDSLVDQVVVDNQDSGFSRSSDGWASYDHSDAYNGEYLYTTDASTGTSWARWTPSLPEAGNYVVQARWRSVDGRYDQVTYKVVHNGTTEAAVPSGGVNQQENSGEWVTIGTWYFDAGGSEYVQLDATESGGSKYCADAIRFVPEAASNYVTVNILNAHYFTFYDADADGELDDDETVYLVTWQDSDNDGHIDYSDDLNNDKRLYFRVTDQDDDGRIEDNDLVYLDPSSDKDEIDRIRPGIYDEEGNFVRFKTDKEDLQNFVNWVSYYRRREFVAKAVVAKTISELAGIQVGFYSLNNNGPRMTVHPVKVKMPGDSSLSDDTETLLDNLYDYRSGSGTPLRSALANVGRYYDDTDSSSGNLGSAPWWPEEYGGACQKAFALIITDGWWNGSLSGYGNVDGDKGAPYADSASDTLADVAMYYWNKDLSDLDNQATDRGCDRDNPKQHMVTYSIAFGLSGTIDIEDIDDDGTKDDPSYEDDPCFLDSNTPRPDWPTPSANNATTIDDLWHASVNGRGLFFAAQNPQELVDAMKAVFEDIGKPASASAVGLNSQQLNEESVVYIARFIPEQWSGELFAYPINEITGEVLNDSAHLLWNAADKLQQAGVTADNRMIVTYNGTAGIPFRESYLTTGQKAQLGVNLPSGKTLSDLVTYLRGDEVAGFRERERRLGDIVHSGPVLSDRIVYVGANDGMLHGFDAETGEEKFAYIPNIVMENLRFLADTNYSANHKFYVDGSQYVAEVRAQSGKWETYLVGGLGKGGKGYYCLNLRTRQRDNANLVVESSVYEATSEAAVASRVAWEYPRAGMPLLTNSQDDDGDGIVDELDEADPDLGYSYSKAYIVRAKDTNNDFRNVVIFGNGYNSYNGHAVLYIMDVENGTVLRKIDTGVGGDNGLSTPAVVDVNGDNLVDYAYAGDLKGNLWKFDLTDEDPDMWGVAYGVDANKNGVIDAVDGDSPAALFSTGGQPITARPDVIKMAIPQDETMRRFIYDMPGYMVVFGTGKLMSLQDRQDISQQSIYGIWDYGEDSDDLEYVGQLTDRTTGALSKNGLFLYRHTLVDQQTAAGEQWRTLTSMDDDQYWELEDDTVDSDGHNNNTGFVFDANDPRKKNPSKYAGWFFDIPVQPDPRAYDGERVVQDTHILNGSAHVVSIWPNEDPCSGGSGSYYYIFNAFTGGRFNEVPQFVNTGLELTGTNGEKIHDKVDIGNDTILPPTGRMFAGLNALNVINGDTYVGDSGGNPLHIDTKAFRMGMFYWREW